MNEMTVGRTVGHGALAGAAAGGVGAAVLYWLVEPLIRTAIAIEEAGTSAESSGHSHATGAEHSHEVLVSRGAQVVFGALTVLVVGVLIGIAFALAHRFLASRLPGRSGPATTMSLAALGFIAFTLAPAIVIPANPPAVGDPATVNLRTMTYLGTILCAVALTAMVTALGRSATLEPRMRIAASTALAVVGTAVLIWALPHAADPVPANIPADLIWSFRVRSLTQIGLMWLVLGSVFAFLWPAPASASAGELDRPATTSSTHLTRV